MSAYEGHPEIAREDLCRFLAACYCEPCVEFDEEELFETMTRAAGALNPDLARHASELESAFSREGPEGLLPDYARLFLGPPAPLAPPYGSVWLEDGRRVMGESTLAAMDLYAELGFELDEGFQEPPDHIAAELEFLYLIIFRENEARRDGEVETLRKISDLKRRFLARHLACWLRPFASAVGSGAQSAFYPALADLTLSFVEAERSAAPAA
jgi:putative dimethyl sulfoxide reductase chaperone